MKNKHDFFSLYYSIRDLTIIKNEKVPRSFIQFTRRSLLPTTHVTVVRRHTSTSLHFLFRNHVIKTEVIEISICTSLLKLQCFVYIVLSKFQINQAV